MLYQHIHSKAILADARTAAFWYPNAQHGGALAGLFMELVQQQMPDPDKHPARLYMSLIRPVMTGELYWEIEALKKGAHIQQVKISLYQQQKLVMHGTLLSYRTRLSAPQGSLLTLPKWADQVGYAPSWPKEQQCVHFAKDVAKVRMLKGAMLSDQGEGAAWIDLGTEPFLGKAPLSGDARIAVVADFSNALSSVVSVQEGRFINADLSVEFIRTTTDRELMLWSKTYGAGEGSGIVDGQIYDQSGLVAFCRQTILLDRGDK